MASYHHYQHPQCLRGRPLQRLQQQTQAALASDSALHNAWGWLRVPNAARYCVPVSLLVTSPSIASFAAAAAR
jgi:hypothetical protein